MGLCTSKAEVKSLHNGKQVERFDTPDADNRIELNGIKSELVICMDKEGSLTR